MTAEIAILNKSAVALAADSTVTIGSYDASPSKTYNTVNKLFTLSKYQPVGVMIFGNADLMGVPWETIIKQYRKQLGKRSFATINEYAEDFLNYLQATKSYFPNVHQRDWFGLSIFRILTRASRWIQDAVNDARTSSGNESEAAEQRATAICERIYKQQLLKCVDEEFKNRLIVEYAAELTEASQAALDECSIAETIKLRLAHAAVYQLCSDRKADSRSGVVLAGFGETQFFPAVHAVSPHLVVLDRLIYSEEPDQCHEIDFKTDAVLIPFAQRDVVQTFLRGINPEYVDMVDSCLETVFSGLSGVVADKSAGFEGKELAAILKSIELNAQSAKEEFFKQLKEEIQTAHINPLLDVIGLLPKDELAAMAEALVNLTSVKRKMSYGPETVGGPIDVAVISKGDGFIWISRKHYFKPELNLQFSQSYLER